MKIEKVDKQISFPKPKSGLLYTPTEFVECLIEMLILKIGVSLLSK